VLNVMYRIKTFPLIGEMYDIRIDEEGLRPMSLKPIAVIFHIVAFVLFAVAVIIAVI